MLYKNAGEPGLPHPWSQPDPGGRRGDCPARCGTIAAKDERPASRVSVRGPRLQGGRDGKSTIVRRDAWTVKGLSERTKFSA